MQRPKTGKGSANPGKERPLVWLESVSSQRQRVATEAIRARKRRNLISILFRWLLGKGLGVGGLYWEHRKPPLHMRWRWSGMVWAGVAGSRHREKRTRSIYILETEQKWTEDGCRRWGKENPDDSQEMGISVLMAGDTTCQDRGDKQKKFVEKGLRVGLGDGVWEGRVVMLTLWQLTVWGWSSEMQLELVIWDILPHGWPVKS